jgi:hypothetical protein
MNPESFMEIDVEPKDKTPILAQEIPVEEKGSAENHPTTFMNKRRNICVGLALVIPVVLYGIFRLPIQEVMFREVLEQPSLSSIDNKVDYGSFRLKGRQNYSSVHCRTIYDDHAQCFFSNIGIRNGEILFYDNPDRPVDFITSRIRHEFPEENFVGIRGGRIDHAARNYYKVVKISEAIPNSAVYLDSDVNVLMTPHYPDNIGHLIGEVIVVNFNSSRI